jgi:hypothetical protein
MAQRAARAISHRAPLVLMQFAIGGLDLQFWELCLPVDSGQSHNANIVKTDVALCTQLGKERFSVLQIEGVEAFREPAIHGRK